MAPALDALKELLLELHNVPDTSVSVFLWQPGVRDQWMIGVRVAEISFSRGSSGFSLMQCETGCFELLFAAERFLITHGVAPFRPEGFEEDIDEHGEAVENLRDAWNKK